MIKRWEQREQDVQVGEVKSNISPLTTSNMI